MQTGGGWGTGRFGGEMGVDGGVAGGGSVAHRLMDVSGEALVD